MAEGKVLVIDSDEKNCNVLKIILANRGYQVEIAFSGRLGVEKFNADRFDCTFLSMQLRDVDPRYIIRDCKRRDIDTIVVALVPPNTIQSIQDAFSEGAYDYLAKPFKPEDVYFTTKRAVRQRQFLLNTKRSLKGLEERNISLQKQNIMLAKRIEESTRNLSHLHEQLVSSYMRAIKALAQALDARDHYTHSHSKNVTQYAEAIAMKMKLDAQTIEHIRDACQLHDLGKIGVHDDILLKPSKLTKAEREEVEKHAMKGAEILEPLSAILEDVIYIVRQHHEHYDGSGYPDGLKGNQIVIGARILAVADTYDSMVSARPYRPIPLSQEETIAEIKQYSGTQFDPTVVDAFLQIVHTF